MIFVTSAVGLAIATYCLFFLTLAVGLLRLRSPRGTQSPSFSIVVPAHDEEPVLQETLEALAAQDYAGTFEVIVVDDRSRDGTAAIVRAFAARDPRFRLVQVLPDEPEIAAPKKRALQRGFELASHEILASTDADCRPPRGWISALASRFLPGVGIVQGPKGLSGISTLCHRYQECETLALVGAEAAGFGLGVPFLASAPSLAYRRDLFAKAGGFRGMEHLPSGDDDMLVHRMRKLPGVRVAYCLDAAASVTTPAADTWAEVLNQRARWASNGTEYENKFYVAALALIFCFWVFLLLGWIPGLFGGSFALWGTAWGAKLLTDLIYLTLAGKRLERLHCQAWCPLLMVPQLAIGIWAALAGHFGWYRWKPRAEVTACAPTV
jgi:cellulose synthase/poly-beta-1,6-N-acetylglucosamine synthase-like glycosyltransferase